MNKKHKMLLVRQTDDLKAGKPFKEKVLGLPDKNTTMNLSVTFVTPQVIASASQIRRVQPPLGIACLAAVLEEYGCPNIQILDASAEGYNNVVDLGDGFIKFGLDDEDVVSKLGQAVPDVVAISALFSSQADCSFSIADAIKKKYPNVCIVMGGIHATKLSNEILKTRAAIDYVVKGESDYSFTLLCNALANDLSVKNVPGLVYRSDDGSEIMENPELPGLDMNELPFPAWHLMDMEMYYDIGMPHNPFMKSREFLTAMTERGCPEKCYFCSSADFFGGSGLFRALTPERTYEMVKHAVDLYGVKELQIEDDTFTLNYKRTIEICKKLAPLGLRITLPNAIRADAPKSHEKRLEMFHWMKEAGFAKLGISAEHGDQEFLDRIVGKRLNLEEVVASIELAHEAGLMVHTNFIMGFPFEEKHNRDKTVSFSKSLNADSFSVSLAAPLPGTKLWDICHQHDLFMPNFDVNRLVYDVVNIRPHDIEPEDLRKYVVKLNGELNEAARNRSEEARNHYELFRGKTATGDRKYS